MLELLVEHGAHADILVDAHPHIGSNKLPQIVQAIRHTIEGHGGEVHFDSRVTDFVIRDETIQGVIVNGEQEHLAANVILATGHSARDIYALLHQKGIRLEPKPFAMGIRIEHAHRDFHFARRIRAFITPTRLSARQISSSHVASLPVEAALDVEPTRAPAFRASLRHRSTPMLFLRQADFVALRPGVSRPAPVAPRSSAACRRTAAGSDALLPAGASSTAHASPGGLRFSPAAAEDS